MKSKNKFALVIALTAFQFFYFGGAVESAEIDKELAIIAAEQDTSSEDFLTPSQNSPSQENFSGDNKKKIADEISKPVEETISVVEEQVNQPETISVVEEQVNQSETVSVVEEKVNQPAENLQPVENPNPMTSYSNFQDLSASLKFTPLYIPKKSGYTMTEIYKVANQTAEIRYGRRWEPEVSLHIRTYKRGEGEELKDISGVHGVKWRIDMTSGATVYIAKINERSHVAAWASGSYTFSAYVENLSFAAFHSLVIDELVDLTTHYYSN